MRKLNEVSAPQNLQDQNDFNENKKTYESSNQNSIDATGTLHERCRDSYFKLNAKVIENAKRVNASILLNDSSNIRKTNEWADAILKDLDNLILSNQQYTANLSSSVASNTTNASPSSPKSPQKQSTIINVVLRKITPLPSPSTTPTSPTAPTAFASILTNSNKKQATIINKISKPEKHVSIH